MLFQNDHKKHFFLNYRINKTGAELCFDVDVLLRTLLDSAPVVQRSCLRAYFFPYQQQHWDGAPRLNKHNYVHIYANKPNTTDKCGGGEDEEGREAV